MDHERKDDDLENLLHSMPKIEDTRSKDELLQRLKDDQRLMDISVTPVRKKRRIVPVIAAVAAVLLVAILIPSFLNSMNLGKQSADQAMPKSDSKVAPAESIEEKVENFTRDASSESAALMGGASQYAVFPADLDGGTIMNIGLQDAQAVSIPVSILLTKEELESKGLTVSSTDLELYNAFAKELDEQSLGFEPLHPIDATFTENGDRLSVFLNDQRKYDFSAAKQEVFLHALMQTFPSYREINILDASGNPAEFDQVGQLEPVHKWRTPFYVYQQENGQELLSPVSMEQAGSFEEALRLMQTAPNDLFAPTIPKELNFTVKLKDGIAEVTFSDTVQLDSMPMNEASRMIDALLLTASSFDVQLKLSHVEPLDFNGLNFRETLPEAIGSNPLPFINK